MAGAGKPKFEMLGFDACLMANTAVLGTLAPLANWITASAELEPGHGWDYSALGAIAGGGGSGADLGKAIANSYQAYADEPEHELGISLAVINDAAVPALDQRGQRRRQRARRGGESDRARGQRHACGGAQLRAQPRPEARLQPRRPRRARGERVCPAARPVAGALNAAVAYKVVGPGLPGGSGVSIYFPPAASTYRKSYANLASVAGWNKFLNAYYASGAAAGGASRAFFDDTEGTTEATADYEFTDAGAFLTTPFTVNEADTITDVRIRYGVLDDTGAPVLVGESPGSFTKGTDGVAGGEWDLSDLVVSDGDVSVPVYRKLTVDPVSNQLTFIAPFAYYPDAKDQSHATTVFGNVTVDLVTGKAQRVYFEVKQDPTQIVSDTDDAGVGLATSGFIINPSGALVPLVARARPGRRPAVREDHRHLARAGRRRRAEGRPDSADVPDQPSEERHPDVRRPRDLAARRIHLDRVDDGSGAVASTG